MRTEENYQYISHKTSVNLFSSANVYRLLTFSQLCDRFAISYVESASSVFTIKPSQLPAEAQTHIYNRLHSPVFDKLGLFN